MGTKVTPLRNFRCEDDLWERAIEIARARGERDGLSGVLRAALLRYVKKYG